MSECEKLWKKFSPNRNFWDLWEARKCFIVEGNNELHFIVGYRQGKPVGILPLCFNEEKNHYAWIGNDFPEHNKISIKNKHDIKYFLEYAPKTLCLDFIDKTEKDFFPFMEARPYYFLNLTKIKNIEEYLKTFSRKHRNNLRHDLRQLEQDGYRAEITHYDDGTLLNVIEKYNIKRFGEKSSFMEKGYKKSLYNLIQFTQNKKILHIICVTKNNQIAGVDLAVLYKKRYIVLMGSSDPEISNVGKLFNYKHIEYAFQLKAGILDFTTGGDGWKKLWNIPHEAMYEFKRE